MSCPSVLEMVLVQVMASFMSVFRVITPSFMPALPHRSDMFITVQSLLSFTVEMSNFFMFISVFVDTAAAWSNDSPVLFCFSFLILLFSPNGPRPPLYASFSILSHPQPLPFFFFFSFCKFCFWRQQVGIDQGDIPDLSQVSVHLTVHLSNSNLLTFFPPKSFSCSTTSYLTALSVLSSTDSHFISPLPMPVSPSWPVVYFLFTLHPTPFLFL